MKTSIQQTGLSKSEIELLIEQKVMELLGDPDSGLQLKETFVKTLNERMKKKPARISHQSIIEKYGRD